MANFFKRHYLNDAKLAQRALLEFHRALSSGRLIAFTGSLTTESCGYGKWSDLIDAYGQLAEVVHGVTDPAHAWQDVNDRLARIGEAAGSDDEGKGKIAGFRKFLTADIARKEGAKFDLRVGLGLFEEVLLAPDAEPMNMARQCGDWELDTARSPINLLSIAIAKYFRAPHRKPFDGDVIGALIDGLGVRRIATLNYDFELEGRLMLADQPHGEEQKPPFERLRDLRAQASGDAFDWQLSSGRIRRVMASGQAIESDILNRERIDRMLEFAIGADDVDHHILHLHGRACDHESMILSYRDYDKLYRRSGLSKLPFEFAQRIMMGGNPILFVGMGMSEGELNQALQDFVSSSPYQRVAPTFLLWNASKEDRERTDGLSRMEMRRLDWFHRLGVLTIFDADLLPAEFPDEGGTSAARLAALIRTLPGYARRIGERESFTGGPAWRHMSKAAADQGPVIVWQLADSSRKSPERWQAQSGKALGLLQESIASEPLACVIAKQGSGKGSLARLLADDPGALGIEPADVLLVNGSFSFDTDSVLDAVARFLDKRTNGQYTGNQPGTAPKISRSAFFRSLADYRDSRLLLVLNGCERFFSVGGDMLSAELHELLWLCARGHLPCVQLVMFGTSRVRTYVTRTLNAKVVEAADIGLEPSWGEETLPVHRFDTIQRAFAERLKAEGCRSVEAIAAGRHRVLEQARDHIRAASAARISGDMPELRRAFFDLYLDPAILGSAIGTDRLDLAMEVLRALAFIGLPAEAEVLVHLPRLRRARTVDAATLRTLFDDLETLGLVLKLAGHSGGDGTDPAARYTLPRLLLTELRARFSVPLSEAKLSTAFNMSLYVAQPIDGYIPEPDIHDELGAMIDRLLGAYRDMARDRPASILPDRRTEMEAIARRLMPHEHRVVSQGAEGRDLVRELETLTGADNIRCLRAALALIRGYYTTTDLLTLDVGDRLIREDRDGILLEHAERLDGLIDAYGKVAKAREELRAAFGTAFDASFGTVEPLYPDELVWLHNERGVIRLAMGDLYEARASFLRALDINTIHVERGDRSHNWRRIRLNQLTLDLESGDISLALRKIKEILSVSKADGDEAQSREDRLARAVALGYRGWAHDLQGDKRGAHPDYDAAIGALADGGEIRAEIYFRRLRVTLLAREDRADESRRELTAAMDLALAARQMDLLYRLRILEATHTLERTDVTPDERRRARRRLEDAHRYALQTDVNRVRVEAGIGMTEARLIAGDYEGAFGAIADAMMVATRFGMELRKIVLRSIMAKIMAERGHPITARNLAATAIRIGSRLRYYQAIRHAEHTLAEIPRISAITELLDAVDRRQV